MTAKKGRGRKSRKSAEIMTKVESRKRLTLSSIFLFVICLLFPLGLLRAVARQETPMSNLTADFIKADRLGRAKMRENLLKKGTSAVSEVLPLLSAPDVEAQLTALTVLEQARATEAVDKI